MGDENGKDIVVAYVTMKTRSGLSIHKDIQKLSLTTIEKFRPNPKHLDQVVNLLIQAGFTIEAQTAVGVSFSGPKELFQSEFGVPIRRKRKLLREPGRPPREASFYKASKQLLMSRRIETIAEAVHLSSPAILFHNANPPVPTYYFLNVLNDIPALLNVAPLHATGITGAGVRVSMVDTGFVTLITEKHVSVNATHVVVDHKVWHVHGVWLASDTNCTGTNYYYPYGSFNGNMVTLPKQNPLPGGATQVQVVYSSLHPHYLSQNYSIADIRTIGGLDVSTDKYGHGSAMAANVLAIAPGCTFSFVKMGGGQDVLEGSFPLAAFTAAVQHQNPDIISCSWGIPYNSPDWNAVLLEVANAVASGIVVLFPSGNVGDWDDSYGIISHPSSISVGGAYPIQGGGFRASNLASSFGSVLFINPQRHCPDVVGLVGETPFPPGVLIMLPTQPGNYMDWGIASLGPYPQGDNTATDDGWIVTSGTSAATPQTAGVAALLLQQYPNLTPMAVKNILENSARDVQTGTSACNDNAVPGWDPATGFGLIDGQAAINFLETAKFSPYIRDSVEDNGIAPVVADRLWASPDIIVLNYQVDDPQYELGQTIKHLYDICDRVEDGQDNYIYLRVQNRGALVGDCIATVYFTDPGMFSNPAAWNKIGQLNIQNLEPGEFRVSGPLLWPDSLVPASGHYCIIAILDSPGEPSPDLATIHSSDDYINMVQNNKNVAWRNIDVEDVIPGSGSSWSFYMERLQGPPGVLQQADLQINLNNFPGAGIVLVKVVKYLADSAILDHMRVVDQSQIYTTLKHLGGIGGLESMDLKSNEKPKVTIFYSIPANTPPGVYSIVATLRIDGNPVNSYTKIVKVSSFSYVVNRRTLEIHKRGCPWVTKMSSYDKMPLADLKKARNRGFKNCTICIGG